MTQRIAGMTVSYNGEGNFDAVYNGQRDKVVEAVKAEMQRQKAALNAEMDSMRDELNAEIAVERDRADINTNKRNEFQSKWLDAFLEPLYKRGGPVKRLLRAVENVWAMFWAITFGGVWKEMGERLGLWVYVGDEE